MEISIIFLQFKVLQHMLIKQKKSCKSYRDTPQNLAICKGCVVMLTTNLNTGLGLSNGSEGKVYDFVFDDKNEVKYILLQMNEKYTGPSIIPGVERIVAIKRFRIKNEIVKRY